MNRNQLKKMKIAYILPSLVKEGPEIVAYDLVCLMQERGHECSVLYFDEKTSNLLPFPCHTQQITMRQRVEFNEYDVVHAHGYRPDKYVYRHRRDSDTAHFVSTIHQYIFPTLKFIYNFFVAVLYTPIWLHYLGAFDVRVCLSRDALQYYRCCWRGKETVCIYNSRIVNHDKTLSDEERNEVLTFKGNAKLLGINALLTKVKGVDIVVKALPFLKGIKLFVAGDGKVRKDLERLSERLGVANRVYCAGYREDAWRYIPYYDIYMMPSRSEGFPLALLEAMSAGCNAVVSDITIFKEFFTDEEVTFFCQESPKDCAKAISEALANPKGAAAKMKYESAYSPKIMGDRYETLYCGNRI